MKKLSTMKTLLLLLLLWMPLTAAQAADRMFVVAQDGSGDFTSLQAAINAVPDHSVERYTIFIKAGLYDEEKLIIHASKPNITLRGEGRNRTVISYHMYNGPSPETRGQLPVSLWKKWNYDPMLVRTSATLTILSDHCRLEHLTLQNSHGPGGQALAVTVRGNRTIFYDCNLLAYQDTIYLWDGGKQTYFEKCLVVGRTDYIYGGGIGYFYRCEISSYGGGWVTAPSTSIDQPYGFIFDRCRFSYRDNSPNKGDDGQPYALGRPWHNYPKVAILRSKISKEVHPMGWLPWNMRYAPTSPDLHLYEYRNRGRGADMSERIDWVGLRALNDQEADNYRIERVFGEHPKNWHKE